MTIFNTVSERKRDPLTVGELDITSMQLEHLREHGNRIPNTLENMSEYLSETSPNYYEITQLGIELEALNLESVSISKILSSRTRQDEIYAIAGLEKELLEVNPSAYRREKRLSKILVSLSSMTANIAVAMDISELRDRVGMSTPIKKEIPKSLGESFSVSLSKQVKALDLHWRNLEDILGNMDMFDSMEMRYRHRFSLRNQKTILNRNVTINWFKNELSDKPVNSDAATNYLEPEDFLKELIDFKTEIPKTASSLINRLRTMGITPDKIDRYIVLAQYLIAVLRLNLTLIDEVESYAKAYQKTAP